MSRTLPARHDIRKPPTHIHNHHDVRGDHTLSISIKLCIFGWRQAGVMASVNSAYTIFEEGEIFRVILNM